MNNNEPVILGKVKKGGASKPILIIIIFLFIGGSIFLLPTILNYFGDYSIIDLVKNGEIIDFIENHDKYMNGNISLKNEKKETTTKIVSTNYISNITVIDSDGFQLTNFNLTKDNISFDVNVNEPKNFDEDYYYLTLKKDNIDLYNIKIVGNISDSSNIKFSFKNKLDTTVGIEGSVKKYNDSDYPKYNLSSDESGLSSLNCKLDNDFYEYIFDNNKLLKIKQKYNYIVKGNTEEYIKEFEKYTRITNEINNTNNTGETEEETTINNNESTITENDDGFIFTAYIDLSIYKKKINNNYYSYNTNSNIIKFDMDAKGYDCK